MGGVAVLFSWWEQSVKSVDKYTDHMGGYEGQGAVLYLSVGVELIFRVSS